MAFVPHHDLLGVHDERVMVPARSAEASERRRGIVMWVIAGLIAVLLIGACAFVTTRYVGARNDLDATRSTLATTQKELKERTTKLGATEAALTSTQTSLTDSQAETAEAKNCLEAIFDMWDLAAEGKSVAKAGKAAEETCDDFIDAHFEQVTA